LVAGDASGAVSCSPAVGVAVGRSRIAEATTGSTEKAPPMSSVWFSGSCVEDVLLAVPSFVSVGVGVSVSVVEVCV